MTEETKERIKPGKKPPNGGVSITAATQKEFAPQLSVYRGPEPDQAFLEWTALDSRGRGAAISEWFELRQVTPRAIRACKLALAELTRMGVNQQLPVMRELRAVVERTDAEL